MKRVDQEEYKYLGIMELDTIKNKDWCWRYWTTWEKTTRSKGACGMMEGNADDWKDDQVCGVADVVK